MAKSKQKANSNKEETKVEQNETTDEALDTQAAEQASTETDSSAQIESETIVDEKDAKIQELEEELANTKDAFVRSLAEYDNFRKRSAKEKENTYTSAKVDCLSKLIPVIDNFERATTSGVADFDAYKKGMEMIYANFTDILSTLGVESFGEIGEEFDPNFHNGVMHVEDEELGENVVSQVFSKGYKIGNKVLREAMVQVAN
ncbi:MAG: nucleotide exchange factor GrpE [Clostridia bacterium]